MDNFEITSNWISDDEKRLNSLIVCSPENKGIESVTAETCICLFQKNIEGDNSAQKLELEIKSKHPIKELNVYSEGSLIEVFGVHKEYLHTCKAEFIDDWEGLAVYYSNIELPEINICTLKFTRTRETNRLWLYSIQATTIKSDAPNRRLFNFQNVSNLINSNTQIPEKPENIRKIVEAQLKTLSVNPQFRLQSLLTLINKEFNVPLEDCKENLSKSLHSLGFLCASGNSSKDDMSKHKLKDDYIINYIDRKFIEMKAELMSTMEKHLAELRRENNEKLEKLFKLIESTKT